MTESFWQKKLIDGSFEQGSDSAIKEGKASWTRGRQDIESVFLSFAGQQVKLECPSFKDLCAEWKQSDHNVYSTIEGRTFRHAREVRCRPLVGRKFGIAKRGEECWVIVGNEGPHCLPAGKEWITCTIRSDGRIIIGWE